MNIVLKEWSWLTHAIWLVNLLLPSIEEAKAVNVFDSYKREAAVMFLKRCENQIDFSLLINHHVCFLPPCHQFTLLCPSWISKSDTFRKMKCQMMIAIQIEDFQKLSFQNDWRLPTERRWGFRRRVPYVVATAARCSELNENISTLSIDHFDSKRPFHSILHK